MSTSMEPDPTMGFALVMTVAARQAGVVHSYTWAFGAAALAYVAIAFVSIAHRRTRGVRARRDGTGVNRARLNHQRMGDSRYRSRTWRRGALSARLFRKRVRIRSTCSGVRPSSMPRMPPLSTRVQASWPEAARLVHPPGADRLVQQGGHLIDGVPLPEQHHEQTPRPPSVPARCLPIIVRTIFIADRSYLRRSR